MPSRPAPLLVLLPGADVPLLGLSVRTRNARVAERHGAEITITGTLAGHGDRPAILVPPSVAIDARLFPLPEAPHAIWLESTPIDGGGTRPAVIAGPARQLARIGDMGAAPDLERQPIADGALLDVSSAPARRAAGWWLLRRTSKPTDGWIARRCNRPVSQAMSYVALHLGVTANQATWLALGVGLGAALIGTRPGWSAFAITGVLFHLASVLDGVDGEIARTTLTESRSGARFDATVDRLTAILCFAGVMVGWVREGAGVLAITGAFAVGLALGLSLLRAFRFVAAHAPGSPLLVIDGAIRRAAARSGALTLRLAAGGFALLRRDLFAVIFMVVGFTGLRALVPVLVAAGIVIANAAFTIYGRQIAAELAPDGGSRQGAAAIR